MNCEQDKMISAVKKISRRLICGSAAIFENEIAKIHFLGNHLKNITSIKNDQYSTTV